MKQMLNFWHKLYCPKPDIPLPKETIRETGENFSLNLASKLTMSLCKKKKKDLLYLRWLHKDVVSKLDKLRAQSVLESTLFFQIIIAFGSREN